MTRDEPRGVVVGVDGSEPARRALVWAMTEAELRGLPLYVVAAQPNPATIAAMAPGPVYTEDVDTTLATVRDSAQRSVDQANEERGKPFEGDLRIMVYSGTATEVLLGLSERHELIVVGSRGAGGFSRLLLGSVSTAVVHHAACPVLVVRQ